MSSEKIQLIDLETFFNKLKDFGNQIEQELSTPDKKRIVEVMVRIPKIDIEYKIGDSFTQDALNSASYLGFPIDDNGMVIISGEGTDFYNVFNSIRKKYKDWKDLVLKKKI